MSAASTDYFTKIAQPGSATSLGAPGHTIAGTSISVDSTTLWPTTTGVIFAIDTVTIGAGGTEVRDPNSYTVWEGVVSSATTITSMVLLYGTDQNYPAGTTTRVYQLPTASRENKAVDGLLITHELTGLQKSGVLYPAPVFSGTATGTYTLGGTPTITAPSISSPTFTGQYSGWTTGLTTPTTVAYNGNRSYSLTYAGSQAAFKSNGMKGRTTRTVAAPNQCTSLNGTTQYWVKTSPNKLTFTDDFVVSAWIKVSAYPSTTAGIITRYNGTSGFAFYISATGQVNLVAYNGSGSNFSGITSYQSIPLNKWVHVAGQLDMSAFTATTTTSYIMIDGVDAPSSVLRGGTNPTAFVQAGNLEIGSLNGTANLAVKIAQAAVYSAKVTQANIRATISQGIVGNETSLASAYSFSNSVTDLNTTTPNDLSVGGGSAVATNADSPFGGQADGTISTTLDYYVTTAVSSDGLTETVQVPEGCTIPTTGGVTALAYTVGGKPYGMPTQITKYDVEFIGASSQSYGSGTAGTWYNTGHSLTVPIGEWDLSYWAIITAQHAGTTFLGSFATLSTANNSDSDIRFRKTTPNISTSLTQMSGEVTAQNPVSTTTATPYFLNLKPINSSTTQLVDGSATGGPAIIRARLTIL